MDRLQAWLERLYEVKICNEYDRVVPIVGDEGKGKSTLMIELTGRWQRIKNEDATPESVLDRVVWDDRDEFKNALANYPRRAAIPVMDAAHVLYKREAMHPDQIDVEKGLLDVRTREFLILLGFQSWGDIPTTLQDRRAKNVLRIPERGVVEGYSRQTLNEKQRNYAPDEWPEPDLVDVAPNLDGTDVWEEFKRRDRKHKTERLAADDDADETIEPQEVVSEIKEDGNPAEYITHNQFNGQTFFDDDLIQFDYPELSNREAEQVKKALARAFDAEALHQLRQDSGGEGTPQGAL